MGEETDNDRLQRMQVGKVMSKINSSNNILQF